MLENNFETEYLALFQYKMAEEFIYFYLKFKKMNYTFSKLERIKAEKLFSDNFSYFDRKLMLKYLNNSNSRLQRYLVKTSIWKAFKIYIEIRENKLIIFLKKFKMLLVNYLK